VTPCALPLRILLATVAAASATGDRPCVTLGSGREACEQALAAATRACDEGDCTSLAGLHRDGSLGLAADPAKAAELLARDCGRGTPYACLQAAELRGGYAYDPARAAALYRRACALDWKGACAPAAAFEAALKGAAATESVQPPPADAPPVDEVERLLERAARHLVGGAAPGAAAEAERLVRRACAVGAPDQLCKGTPPPASALGPAPGAPELEALEAAGFALLPSRQEVHDGRFLLGAQVRAVGPQQVVAVFQWAQTLEADRVDVERTLHLFRREAGLLFPVSDAILGFSYDQGGADRSGCDLGAPIEVAPGEHVVEVVEWSASEGCAAHDEATHTFFATTGGLRPVMAVARASEWHEDPHFADRTEKITVAPGERRSFGRLDLIVRREAETVHHPDGRVGEVEREASTETWVWLGDRYLRTGAKLEDVTVRASGSLPGSKREPGAFAPERATDGDPSTTWAVRLRDVAAPEAWIELEFRIPQSMRRLVVTPGFASSEALFRANARPKRVEVSIDGGPPLPFTLADRRERQILGLPGAPFARRVRITVRELFPGQKYPDLCVSEIVPSE
jgi:hypothetical protein